MAIRYLERLEIEAFRGISGLVLEDLAAVNIVVGANNTGKTSVLEAAALALHAENPREWVAIGRGRDEGLSSSAAAWSLFPGTSILTADLAMTAATHEVVLRASVEGKPRKVEASATPFALDDGGKLTFGIDVSVVTDDNSLPFVIPFVAGTRIPKKMFQVCNVDTSTHRSTQTLVTALSYAIDRNQKQTAISMLRFFDPAVNDLDIVASDASFALRITHEHRGVVDLSSFGDGMRRSVAMALMLARASDGLLLIDEIETGIHPTALVPVFRQLLAAAKQANVQILATTHSIEAVDALAEAATDVTDIAAYRLHRRGGALKARRYEQERLKTIRKEGLDVR
jgi:AAA15 family ATPase/GTPase